MGLPLSEKLYLSRTKSARIGLRELIEKEFYGGFLYVWTIKKNHKKEFPKYVTDNYGDILWKIANNKILFKFNYSNLLYYMEKINVLP